jgi:hypothetical protein
MVAGTEPDRSWGPELSGFRVLEYVRRIGPRGRSWPRRTRLGHEPSGRPRAEHLGTGNQLKTESGCSPAYATSAPRRTRFAPMESVRPLGGRCPPPCGGAIPPINFHANGSRASRGLAACARLSPRRIITRNKGFDSTAFRYLGRDLRRRYRRRKAYRFSSYGKRGTPGASR